MNAIRSFLERMSPTSYVVSVETKNSKNRVQKPDVQEIDFRISAKLQAHKQIFNDFVATRKIINKQITEIKRLEKRIVKNTNSIMLKELGERTKLLNQMQQVKMKLIAEHKASTEGLIKLHNEVEPDSKKLQNFSSLKKSALEGVQNFGMLRKLNLKPLDEIKQLGKLVDYLQGIRVEVAGTTLGKKTITDKSKSELISIIGRLSILTETSQSTSVKREASKILNSLDFEFSKSVVDENNLMNEKNILEKISKGDLPVAEKKEALEQLSGRLKISENVHLILKKKLDTTNKLPAKFASKVSVKLAKKLVDSTIKDTRKLIIQAAEFYKNAG